MQRHALLLKEVLEADSVDVLLDFAFTQKEKKNYEDAILAFSMACDLFPSAQIKVLFAIETANIHKEVGNYDLAILALEKGLLNTLEESIKNDFLRNICYLTTVRDTLLKRHKKLVAYEKIPTDIQEEIEAIFKQNK